MRHNGKFLKAFPLSALLALRLAAAEPSVNVPLEDRPLDPVVHAKLSLDLAKPGPRISPLLHGIFFEEINRAGEGGLWAELLQNPAFGDSPERPLAWTLLGAATASLDRDLPPGSAAAHSLRLSVGTGGGGVANRGFSREAGKDRPAYAGGLALRQGEPLRLKLWQRGDTALRARLEASDGRMLAEAALPAPGANWTRAEAELTPSADDGQGRLVLWAAAAGTVSIAHSSLMPLKTWKGHGLRPDLAQLVADMKPAFVRFPGGCFVEGQDRPNALRWKDSIGAPEARRGVANLWGYRTQGQFGLHEFLQWCEDLGAEPLYVINCGMGHGFAVPPAELPAWVQDALDLVDYANGPADSPWGAKRAAAGHPAPFKLRYLEIGNENGGPDYEERYALFYDALKKRYPDIHLIANAWPGPPKSRPVDILDEHYYLDQAGMLAMAGHYDGADRRGHKIYVGEYAVTQGCGLGNLRAALGEAAFLCGLEANGDVVQMSSYAPLLVQPAWKAWNPNAIVFDQGRAYGTPSYHVQVLFASHRGDSVCPSRLEQPRGDYVAPRGRFGVGTWTTQAEFKDIRFTAPDGTLVFSSDFTRGLEGWTPVKGTWSVVDGALRQSGEGQFSVAGISGSAWQDGTFELKARKLGGAEGFQIQFQAEEEGQQRVWNLGGWGNTQHGLQGVLGEPKVKGHIETGRWYDIRIELAGPRIRCFLDGKLLQEAVRTQPPRLYAVASRMDGSGDLIVKVVNSGAQAADLDLEFRGGPGHPRKVEATVLSSASPDDENSFEQPEKLKPVRLDLAPGAALGQRLAPYSVTVLRYALK